MKKYFNKYKRFTIAVAIAMLPAAGFSQEAEDQPVQDIPDIENPAGTSTNSGLSTSPWPGSSGSSTNETQQQRPGANSALRPVGGNSVLNTPPDPSGNPDVPFDDNMNLGFLAVGIVFAFVVYRKNFTKKPVTVKK